MKKIYLGIPFSGIEELSFKCANEVASLLIANKNIVFSPISHSYPIWKTNMVEHTYEIWLEQDKSFVEWADEIYMINIISEDFYGIDKIANSKGCQMEINWAKELKKPISFIKYKMNTKEIENV